MRSSPRFTLSATTLDAPDARKPARFHKDLLGWPVRKDEPDWVGIGPSDGGAGLPFRTKPLFTLCSDVPPPPRHRKSVV